MKKILALLLILCVICAAAAGCSDGGNARQENYLTINPNPPSSSNDESDTAALSPDAAAEYEAPAQPGVDVDLTALSGMMVYAEVFSMMRSPEDYVGKTVKMCGSYYAQYYEETEQCYHYVVIEDATACCQQGLEFVWNGKHSYPNDYPADNTQIEVAGVFGSYEELGVTYYHLAVDNITVL